jgi:hypothetical protein
VARADGVTELRQLPYSLGDIVFVGASCDPVGLMKTLLMGVAMFALAAPALAAPHISCVVSAADFKPGITLNSFGTIFGTRMSDSVYQAPSAPFPASLFVGDAYDDKGGTIVSGSGTSYDVVPEPSAGVFMMLALCLLCARGLARSTPKQPNQA